MLATSLHSRIFVPTPSLFTFSITHMVAFNALLRGSCAVYSIALGVSQLEFNALTIPAPGPSDGSAPVPGDSWGAVSLSGDGSCLVVGAPQYSYSYVYTYRCAGDSCDPSSKSSVTFTLFPPGGFGSAVALSHAGTFLAVGAPTFSGNGAVFTYSCSACTCSGGANIVMTNNLEPASNFGYAIVLSSDAVWLVVGAPTAQGDTGAVSVYACDVSAGTCDSASEQIIYPSDCPSCGGFFGNSVAFGPGIIAIARPNYNPASGNLNEGRVYVYVYSSAAAQWIGTASHAILQEVSSRCASPRWPIVCALPCCALCCIDRKW